jgi:hypothetical protein
MSPVFCFKIGTQKQGYTDKNDFAVLETEDPFPKQQPNIPLFSYNIWIVRASCLKKQFSPLYTPFEIH